MRELLPASVMEFEKKHPQIWQAFSDLAEKCHETGGPLDERTRRLVKLAAAIAFRHEGAVHSATRQAIAAGLSPGELYHVPILTITTIRWPAAYAAMTWIADIVEKSGPGTSEYPPT